MLKPLTAEGRFECGLDDVVKGKVWAFVPVMNRGAGPQFQLAVAIANEQGYNPIPVFWAHAESYDEMADHADELNRAEGLSEREAAKIVCSSMNGKAVAA